VRVAAAAGIGNVVLSGGNSDSVLARKWIVERFGAGIPQPHSTDDLETAAVINCTLRVATDGDSDDDRHEWPAPGVNERDRAAPPVALRLWVENRSTTTATNAEFTAALLDRPNSPLGAHGEVVVVSSPYHLPRCRVFFGRYLPTRERYFIASAPQEFQWLLPPDPAWIDVRLFFADETVPAGVLCQRPHCIIVRHPRAPFGYLLPRSVLTFVHSLVASWRAFNGVLILTLWSTPAGAWAREVGAFASNFASHRYELADLRHV